MQNPVVEVRLHLNQEQHNNWGEHGCAPSHLVDEGNERVCMCVWDQRKKKYILCLQIQMHMQVVSGLRDNYHPLSIWTAVASHSESCPINHNTADSNYNIYQTPCRWWQQKRLTPLSRPQTPQHPQWLRNRRECSLNGGVSRIWENGEQLREERGRREGGDRKLWKRRRWVNERWGGGARGGGVSREGGRKAEFRERERERLSAAEYLTNEKPFHTRAP